MSTAETRGAPARKRRSRKWWPATGAIIGFLAGAIVFFFTLRVYEASTSILVIPQRVPEDIVRSTITAPLGERLNVMAQQILSRTSLERIVQEFNLYERERERLIMEDLIEGMRSDISVSIDAPQDGEEIRSFRISFQSPDARTAMRVTERLAALFVQENLEDRTLMADQTQQFLQTQVEESEQRLIDREDQKQDAGHLGRALPQWMLAEYEFEQEHYRSLLRKQADARMALNMERRQIGEQFRIIDDVRLPEQPVSPARLPFLLWGALGGLATSLLLMWLAAIWRRRRSAAPAS